MRKLCIAGCVMVLICLVAHPGYAATKGKVLRIDNVGTLYISLGLNDGLQNGDIVDIHDDSNEYILSLAVQETYMNESRLELPRRKYLDKIEQGYPVYIQSIAEDTVVVSAGHADAGREVKVMAFDKTTQTGFISVGCIDGMKDGTMFVVGKDGKTLGDIIIERAFDSVSKFSVVGEMTLDADVGTYVLRSVKGKEGIAGLQWLTGLRDEFSGEVRSIYTHYEIERNKSQSFYKTGSNFREEMDLRYRMKTQEGIDIDGFASGRWTDDTYVDPERYSMEEFYIQAKNDLFKVRAGDFLGDFSDYTLLSSLKGVSGELYGADMVGTWAMKSIFGLTKNLWEDMWENIEGEDYTQYVYGMRFEHAIYDTVSVGINAVRSDDDADGTGTGNPQDNWVSSVDFKGTFYDHVTIDGEIASSWTQLDESGSSLKRSNDTAIDMNTEIDIGEFTVENDYERVGAYFRSLNGIASTDREEFKHAISFDHDDIYGGGVRLRNYRNNLKNTATYTLFNTIYGCDTFVKPFVDMLPELRFVFDFEKHEKYSGDNASSVDEDKTTYDFTLENKTGPYFYGGGITMIREMDTLSERNTHKKAIYDMFVRSNHTWGKLRFLPYVMYEHEHDTIRYEKQANDFSTLRMGGALYYGPHVSLSGSWVYTDTNYDGSDDDQTREYCDISLRVNMLQDYNKVLRVSFKRNDYSRAMSVNDYIENVFSCSYTQKF